MWARSFAVGLGVVCLTLCSCSDNGTPPAPTNNTGGTAPSITISDLASVDEGANATFTVTLSQAATADVTVQYTLVDLSTSDSDFSGALSGTATIPAGAVTTNIVAAVANDDSAEGSELFQMVLSAPTQATLADNLAVSHIAPSDGGVDVSFAMQLAPLFSAKGCAGCHGTNGGGFNVGSVATLLTTGDHKPNVVPGLGGQSNVYLKTTDNPPFGSRMPMGGPELTSDEQKLIRDWIDQGAQDN